VVHGTQDAMLSWALGDNRKSKKRDPNPQVKGSYGTVEIHNAKVHWFITPLVPNDSDAGHPPGTIGVIYKNEIYEVTSRQKDMSRFRLMGIRNKEVRHRLSIFVEPDHEAEGIYTNGSRSRLTVQASGDLPWERWGFDFEQVMPAEIKDLITLFDNPMPNGEDLLERIQQEIAERYKHLLAPQTPTRPSEGQFGSTGDGPAGTTTGSTLPDTDTKQKGRGGGKGHHGQGNSDVPDPSKPGPSSGNGTSRPRVKASKHANTGIQPKIIFEDLDGLIAAQYDRSHNRLIINQKFSVFAETVTRMMDYLHLEDREKVQTVVLEKYAVRLGGKVIEALAYGERMRLTAGDLWSSVDSDSLLDDHALTLAVLGLDADELIKATLHGKKGSGAIT